MISVAQDRRSLRWELARRSRGTRAGSRTMGAGGGPTQAQVQAAAAVTTAASQGFANPVSDVMALLSLVGLNSGSKALYQQEDPLALKAVASYGPDFVAGSAQLGLNPVEVASAMSDYLAENSISLTPSELLAAFSGSTSQGSSVTSTLLSIPTPYLMAGAAGVVLLMLAKR